MFETSVVQARAQAAGGRLRMLTISIAAHTTAIIGAVAMSIASVDFPKNAPDEYMLLTLEAAPQIPPPLGDPNGGTKAQTQAAPKPQPQPQTQPNVVTAPPTIPNDVPVLETPSSNATGSDAAGPGTGTNSNPVGVPWGVDGGAGDLNAPPSTVTTAPVEERIYQAYEVTPPVAISKPAPPYPQMLLKTKMRATVIVRCIIDKNGRVRDAEVIKSAPIAAFDQSVLNTVTTWRYKPGSLNGVAVETYLNVTVNFAVQ